jgi:hypothetical protein
MSRDHPRRYSPETPLREFVIVKYAISVELPDGEFVHHCQRDPGHTDKNDGVDNQSHTQSLEVSHSNLFAVRIRP